ncbi:MAG: TIGR04255 family protein [Sporichthyaceae bacterium]
MPLPAPDRTVLTEPPLVAVLAQIRYAEKPDLADARAGAGLMEVVEPRGLAVLTQVHHQQLTMTADAGSQPVASSDRRAAGWRMGAKDESAMLTVLTDQMSLEVRAYHGGWQAFGGLWGACLDAVEEAAAPELVLRIGLRYVNRVTPAGIATAKAFADADLVDPTFLGPAIGSDLSEYVTASEGRLSMSFPDGTEAIVHHGLAAGPGTRDFVLDIDCFRGGPLPFSSQGIRAAYNALNETSLQIFQTVFRGRMRAEFMKVEASS